MATISHKIEGTVLTTLVSGFDPIIVDLRECAPDVQEFAPMFGLKQTIGDAGALAKGSTASEKYFAMKARADQLKLGWRKDREGGIPRQLIAEAMARLYKLTEAKAAEMLGKHDDAAVQKLAADPKVAGEIAKIRSERAGPEAHKAAADIMAEFKKAAA